MLEVIVSFEFCGSYCLCDVYHILAVFDLPFRTLLWAALLSQIYTEKQKS